VVVILVSTTFLVQNQYYQSQLQLTSAHDNARAATEIIASEVRSVMEDGIQVAGARTLTVRTPIMLAVVCNIQGSNVDVHSDGGDAGIDTLEVAGVAIRDTTTGAWSYYNTTWKTIDGSGGTPAASCAANGADTTGGSNDFHRLKGLKKVLGSLPDVGDMLMIFGETTLKFDTSEMDSTTVGLFRQIYGDTPVEYATGMDTTAQFQYRTGGATYSDTVTAAKLQDIDVIRIVADARARARTGGKDDVTFGWSVNVALRNIRDD